MNKQKIIVLLLLTLLLAFVACDRFEHEVYENEEIESFFSTFNDSLQTASLETIDNLMSFFSEDYLNNAMNKDGIQATLLSIIDGSYEGLTVQLKSYYENLSVNWAITGNESNVDGTFPEELLYFNDFLKNTDDGYKFYGNQVSPPAYDETKPMVVAQMFSATTCGNCPTAALKLDELKRQYGGQFVYLEYLFDGPNMAQVALPFLQYYGLNAQPSTVFQGQHLAAGGAPDVISSYPNLYEESEGEKIIDIELSDIVNNNGMISGTVTIENFDQLPTADLVLEAVLAYKHSDYHYQVNGQAVHNVVYSTTQYDLTESEIEFIIENEPVTTDDVMLVVWVRTKSNSFDAETCKIYDAKVHTFESTK